ncbi:MAG TPA: NADH-quinone oxidoreductase subunit A [bacterium]|nr:NADH-quinone oxidoreductase subunit A [bacterium]
MLHDYFGILVMIILACGVSALFIFLSQALGPKKPNPAKRMPFECGKAPFETPAGRHAVKFYIAGMLFVLFDVEMIFFFPWAVLYRELGFFGFAEMMVFMAVLVLGFVYAVKKGALQWK